MEKRNDRGNLIDNFHRFLSPIDIQSTLPNLSPETGEMNGKEGIFRKQPACIVTFSLVVRNKKKKKKGSNDSGIPIKLAEGGEGDGFRRSSGDGDPLNGNRTKAKRLER